MFPSTILAPARTTTERLRDCVRTTARDCEIVADRRRRAQHPGALSEALQAALGLGDAHPFARAQPDEARFELGDYREHVEQKSPDGIGWGRGPNRQG